MMFDEDDFCPEIVTENVDFPFGSGPADRWLAPGNQPCIDLAERPRAEEAAPGREWRGVGCFNLQMVVGEVCAQFLRVLAPKQESAGFPVEAF